MDHDGIDNGEPWTITVDGFSLVKVALHKNELSITFNAWTGSELDIVKGECDIKGFLKWDGCLNFMTNSNRYYHLCRPDDMTTITTLFNAIGDEAVKHVRGYEGEFKTEPS